VKCKAHGKSPCADQLREHGRLLALGFDVVVLDRKNKEELFNSTHIERCTARKVTSYKQFYHFAHMYMYAILSSYHLMPLSVPKLQGRE
jgi:hypothetical protein